MKVIMLTIQEFSNSVRFELNNLSREDATAAEKVFADEIETLFKGFLKKQNELATIPIGSLKVIKGQCDE